MVAHRLRFPAGMAISSPRPLSSPRPADALPPKPVGFHGAVTEFKRRLIEATLCQWGGNRTRAARALGLQRTYLLRLMREFEVNVPRAGTPPPAGPRPDESPVRGPKNVDTRAGRG